MSRVNKSSNNRLSNSNQRKLRSSYCGRYFAALSCHELSQLICNKLFDTNRALRLLEANRRRLFEYFYGFCSKIKTFNLHK